MFDVDWRVHETDDVALVSAVVESTAPTPRRIVVDPRIDGTVLPPRRRGLPERGWRDEAYVCTVPAEGRLALGFACRGELEDPPVAVVDEGRVSRDGEHQAEAGKLPLAVRADTDDLTPTAVLRDLGSPVPPRDAVPTDAQSRDAVSTDARARETVSKEAQSLDTVLKGVRGSGPTGDRRSGAHPDQDEDDGSPEPADPARRGTRAVPDPTTDWLEAVATRVDRAERLATDRDLEEAVVAVETVGGIAGVERLVDALEADEAALRAVADRATELAGACDVREDVPVEAYRQLS